MVTIRRQFGDLGEKEAVKYLKSRGYEIVDTNWKNSSGRCVGEIDIIAKDETGRVVVFIEVKTREMGKHQNSLPEENINYLKLQKLQKIANIYLNTHRVDGGYRFDAISVWLDINGKEARIKHIESL